MTENILKAFKRDIETFTLLPSDGGRFEVTVNGDLVFSKLKEGRFPKIDEVQPKIAERM
ncbi:MAG TPA: selenoprotein [Candidatus Latescibacteria bacterium]|nr:selenoprotein [Gemmatimonadota bacterium]HCR17961.1 selenoprotein [Candidatus Latescibacterota bacterium]